MPRNHSFNLTTVEIAIFFTGVSMLACEIYFINRLDRFGVDYQKDFLETFGACRNQTFAHSYRHFCDFEKLNNISSVPGARSILSCTVLYSAMLDIIAKLVTLSSLDEDLDFLIDPRKHGKLFTINQVSQLLLVTMIFYVAAELRAIYFPDDARENLCESPQAEQLSLAICRNDMTANLLASTIIAMSLAVTLLFKMGYSAVMFFTNKASGREESDEESRALLDQDARPTPRPTPRPTSALT